MSDSIDYTPLTDEQQIIVSGQVLASGEANYAALDMLPDGQGPLPLSGINTINTSGVLSGVYYAPAVSGQDLLDKLEVVSGIFDSNLNDGDLSYVGEYEPPDLGIFGTYIHYYPATVQNLGPLYIDGVITRWITVPIKIDYSFILQPYTSFERYIKQTYGYDAVDASGDPIFDNTDSVPPTRFR